MVKIKVVEFVNALNVIKYLEEDKNQKRLNFIAKDKLLSIMRYKDKLKSIEDEKEKFAIAFGSNEYTLQQGEPVEIYGGKLLMFSDTSKLESFIEILRDNTNPDNFNDINNAIKDTKTLVDFTTGSFIKAGNSFYKLDDVDKFNKYYEILMNTELELLEARPFQRDDLSAINEFMVGDIALLGPLYAGNEFNEESDSISIPIDESDLLVKKPKKTETDLKLITK